MQGFAPSLCRHNGMVRSAALLPSTIYDLTISGQETLVARRMSGSNPVHWHGQTPRAVRSFRSPPMVPFIVVLINPDDDVTSYVEWAASCVVPPVLVAQRGGDIDANEVSAESLRKLFLERCERIPDTIESEAIAAAKQMLSSWVEPRTRKLDYQVGGHNSVAPNILVLASLGYDDMVFGPFQDINHGTKPYVDQIVRTAKSVFEERGAVGYRDIHRIFRPTPDLNLFAPSIYPHFLQMPMPPGLNSVERKRFQQVLQALRRQEGYGFETKDPQQFRALFGVDPNDVRGEQAQPKPHPLMVVRAQELGLATAAMAALAVSEVSAVARLPNDINRSAGIVRSFAQQYGGNAPSSRKRLLGFREVQKRLAEAVPREFFDLINQSRTGVRIVADAHLEWLDIDGLPLGIRRDTCRIPSTPGNLFISTTGPHEHLRLPTTAFRHILVISALKRDDPIRSMFEIAFDTFSKVWKDKMRIDVVDVAGKQEFVDALNAFDGQVVVFDGHGAHREGSAAALYLQDEPLDVWSLHDQIGRMPPIVILSACDTHAADRNHATAANGFLALGARAVLASVLPLDAVKAATFAARLIYRLADYLDPAVGQFDRALSWLQVVSGMIRMQLLTDFLMVLRSRKKIDDVTYVQVHQEGNSAINGGTADPFGVVVDALVATGLDRADVLKDLEFAVANSSAISYVHVGRPETILIDVPARVRAQMEGYRALK